MLRAGKPGARHQAGFTLIEMLVVIAIMALVMSAVALAPRAGSRVAELKSAAFETAALLRQTRSRAIIQGRPETVTVDLGQRLISAPNARAVRIANGIAIELTSASSERLSANTAGILFYPNGSSTGATLRFTGGTKVLEVRANWLSGRVSINDPG